MNILKRALRPLLICLALSVGLLWALHTLQLYSFFDRRTRLVVLGCTLLLFVAVWLGFWAELREIRRAERARLARLQRQRERDQQALRQAAELLSGRNAPEAEADEDAAPEPRTPATL